MTRVFALFSFFSNQEVNAGIYEDRLPESYMIVKYWVAHFVISGTCFRGFAKLWRQEPAAAAEQAPPLRQHPNPWRRGR